MIQEPNETVDLRIDVERMASSDLLLATSPDLPGLTVHGRSFKEIMDLLPGRIGDLLSYQEKRMLALNFKDEGGYTPADRIDAQYTYEAA